MERSSKSVWTTSGEDVTEAYKNGAIKAYQKLQEKHIDLVIMKEKSPSCGTHSIYDGSFSGYSSVHDELAYQLDDMFSLPAFPLMQVTSLVTKVRAGYFFGEANAVEQLKKNQRPMLFIHGDEDTFVPFEMLDKVYRATKGPKEKYVVKGAEHAEAYKTDPEKYQQVVQQFLSQYVH